MKNKEELLSAFCDGELTSQEMAELKRHLKQGWSESERQDFVHAQHVSSHIKQAKEQAGTPLLAASFSTKVMQSVMQSVAQEAAAEQVQEKVQEQVQAQINTAQSTSAQGSEEYIVKEAEQRTFFERFKYSILSVLSIAAFIITFILGNFFMHSNTTASVDNTTSPVTNSEVTASVTNPSLSNSNNNSNSTLNNTNLNVTTIPFINDVSNVSLSLKNGTANNINTGVSKSKVLSESTSLKLLSLLKNYDINRRVVLY